MWQGPSDRRSERRRNRNTCRGQENGRAHTQFNKTNPSAATHTSATPAHTEMITCPSQPQSPPLPTCCSFRVSWMCSTLRFSTKGPSSGCSLTRNNGTVELELEFMFECRLGRRVCPLRGEGKEGEEAPSSRSRRPLLSAWLCSSTADRLTTTPEDTCCLRGGKREGGQEDEGLREGWGWLDGCEGKVCVCAV